MLVGSTTHTLPEKDRTWLTSVRFIPLGFDAELGDLVN